MKKSKIILFGGNGFVGTAIAEELVYQGLNPVCVSRTGAMPMHLHDTDWAQQVEWLKGDALDPDPNLLMDAVAVVALIGSPPVPTFSKTAYARQLAMNSDPNLAVINAMTHSSLTRLVLMGAHLPKIAQTDKFAYAKGKRLCEEAAMAFAKLSDQHTSVVLKPTAIYGVRHSQTGKPINVAAVMRPAAKLQSMIPTNMGRFLPERLVSVSSVAGAAVKACLDDEFVGKFTVLTNQQIVDQA